MQRLLLSLFAILLAAPLVAVEIGDVVFKTSFDEPNVLDRWIGSRAVPISLTDGAIRVSLPAEGTVKHTAITQQLPPEQVRGTRLRISGRIKAENVAEPPQSYNGIKMMLILDAPSGKQWLQRDEVWGTFDWKEISFLAEVPPDTTNATLFLGIENTTGTAWFDDITITVIGKRPIRPTDTPATPVYK